MLSRVSPPEAALYDSDLCNKLNLTPLLMDIYGPAFARPDDRPGGRSESLQWQCLV